MADDAPLNHAAAFRARRRAAGWRKLSFWLRPEDDVILARLKSQYGTDEATVRAALRKLASEAS